MVKSGEKWRMVGVYSAAHFLVDFTCAFLMFRFVRQTQDWVLCMLLYNFCAFALQMPLGILADRWNRNALFAVIGCGLILSAFLATPVPVAAAVVAGVGNGMFHVGGGIDVLNHSGEHCGALGVFVSPGALGLYLGTLWGTGDQLSPVVAPLLLLGAAVAILAMRRLSPAPWLPNAPCSLDGLFRPGALLALLCMFLVVCLRSCVGMTLNFPWKGIGWWGVTLTCAVVLGKTLGGFLADRIGPVPASLASLGLAALLFLFSNSPPAGVAAVLLFNMTMPITLWAVAKLLPGAKGFSFGLLTFGLFVGFLPVYWGSLTALSTLALFGACLISLGLLWLGLRRTRA